jgi:hypothetical protein
MGKGKACTVCSSEHLAQINVAIASGVSMRHVADRYRLIHHAVFRHQRDHLPSELRAALTLKLLVREGDVRSVMLEEGVTTVEAVRAIRAALAAKELSTDPAAQAFAAALMELADKFSAVMGEMADKIDLITTERTSAAHDR